MLSHHRRYIFFLYCEYSSKIAILDCTHFNKDCGHFSKDCAHFSKHCAHFSKHCAHFSKNCEDLCMLYHLYIVCVSL